MTTNISQERKHKRSNSWSLGEEVKIDYMGKNIVILKRKPFTNTVTLYRAEADPNQRLDSNGIIEKKNRHGQETMLFISIGGDPKRTEDFLSQARERETRTELARLKELKQSFKRTFYDINKDANYMRETNQRDHREDFKEALIEYAESIFDANGQTIRSSEISFDLFIKIMISAVTEKDSKERTEHVNFIREVLRNIGDIMTDEIRNEFEGEIFGFDHVGEVLNVDTTKSYNQFGVRGRILEELKPEVVENGVRKGLTHGRSRSEPPSTRFSDTITPQSIDHNEGERGL